MTTEMSLLQDSSSRDWLTIIPRTRIGYELLDSERGAEHRVGYHKLISNKCVWNNCFIKYQTLDKNISICQYSGLWVSRSVSIFGQTTEYRRI